jgi:C4-type Zn-finger protein
MLRDESVDAERFISKFEGLKKSFDERVATQLDSEYHKQLKAYIERLYEQTCGKEEFTDDVLGDIREAEMSNLNRLQKLKNGSSYKKDKHKSKHHHEDWG